MGEVVVAMMLFLIVATAIGVTLTSSVSANGLARDRTIAQQVANDRIESIRSLSYDSVGTVGGNPPGTVPASQNVSVNAVLLTERTRITYVDDSVPNSFATAANYKKVVVTVTRERDSLLLAKEATYIAPPARALYGGANKGVIQAKLIDFELNSPVPDATVDLQTGPDAPRSDSTDASGSVTFAGLTANPTSGSQSYYDLGVAAPGYDTLAADVPPSSAAHLQLAPGQVLTTVLRVYRPSTINIVLRDALGQPYAGAATVSVASSRVAQEFPATGGSLSVTQVGGESVAPGLPYTVSARAAGSPLALFARAVTQVVPQDYPNDLTSNFTLTLTPYATGTLSVQVRKTTGGAAVPGARVEVTGGPVPVFLTGTSNSSGAISFAVPVGSGYTVNASGANGEGAGQATATALAGLTTSVQVNVSPGGG